MADQTPQNPGAVTNVFNKALVKDYNDTFNGEGAWTHARNAVNNSHDGQVGVIGNEPSNLHCVTLPYTLIGCIHLLDDRWAIFTTDDVNCEIGVFDESQCTYIKKINDPALGFKRSHLITGMSRRRFDCAIPVYWADGLNPDRFVDLDNPPYKYTEKVVNDCVIKTNITPLQIDTEELRLAAIVDQPCVLLTKGKGAGTLANGSYQICIGYTINQVKVGDYVGFSNIQSLFTHENLGGSLDVVISNIDKDYEEFELVILSTINHQTVAKRLGYYSTAQGTIHIDTIDPELVSIPINQIPLRTESIEKSNAMYSVNGYLLRIGTYSKYQFNYQQQANKITSSWVAVQYSSDYYSKGGNKVGYLRDEQYAFFIRWVYNTGERSASFHIPGRPSTSLDKTPTYGGDAFETTNSDLSQVQQRELWQVQNTGTVESVTSYKLADGGVVIAGGKMGFWESEEKYPSDKYDIWGDLCGKKIRHHKFPDLTVSPALNHFNSDGANIVILGVQFDNITRPVDINGVPIDAIVGYEILRGSREGQKSIIAKGMLNNLRQYDIPGNTVMKGLYQNYPYNDLRSDPLLTSDRNIIDKGSANENMGSPLTAYKKDMFSFHSPDTTFTKPFLAFSELKVYQELYGVANGSFVTPYKHPKFKVLTNFTSQFASILGVITSIGSVLGAFASDFNLSLQGTEDLPYTKKLTLTKMVNFGVGGGGSVLGTGGSVTIPNPAVVIANTAIGIYNAAIAVAMSFIEAESTGEQLFNIVRGLVPTRQYSLQYNSHGFYNKSLAVSLNNRRKRIENATYVGPNLQSFDTNYSINNLYRSNFVALKLQGEINDPANIDESRFRIAEKGGALNTALDSPISGMYGALKISVPSQYGQLESIKQLIISSCTTIIDKSKTKFTSEVLFGGDTYIGRFTEKNSFFFFNNWLTNEPNETEIDYRDYMNVAYPRFWIDTNKVNFKLFQNASVSRHLDMRESSTFFVTRGYFYLFFSGVRDFFVESEINLAHRDWEEELSKRHYDPYVYEDYNTMFRSDIIKSGNYYKYDYSLSVSKLFNNFASWGNLYPRDYDPKIADTCYVYRPKRVIYSLPQEQEVKKDNWRVFLTNNRKDFNAQITSIKSVNRTGALFMLDTQSPLQFTGVDQLQTDIGTKITLGDGGLFQQPLQSLVNADESYEYGSCQNKFAVAGTTHGVFWVSQNTGKVFQYAGQLDEISRGGLKWWFAKYLPSELLRAFPDYPLHDNPVSGIGVQLIYDNTNEILYMSKKDYKPKFDMYYDDGGFYRFVNNIKVYYPFSDRNAWEDASWTMSYDPKVKGWISMHDWKPTFLIPGKAHFMSVNDNSIWKHNVRCDSYCNFYGIDYPFEIEFVSATGQTVTSMRNVEYILEAYKYHHECRDRFHVLDENFDYAIIYNSEQISGLLHLNLKSKSNPLELLSYPQIMPNYINIQFSKEENKYRFNQFWDITKNRGEFSSVNIPMFNTQSNGYIFDINTDYVDYQTSALERKKFRHNTNKVFLRKLKSGNTKFLFKLSNQKILQSVK